MTQKKQKDIEYLESQIRNVPDFPKEGIQFKDITTLLKDPKALKLTSELLKKPFTGDEVDQVVGLESRGFLFGPRLAQDLKAGFVPIRKPGKLPVETIEATYELEYGQDSIEMHTDAINKGDKVIIHDDLIATGGSAAAATTLVQKLGGVVIGYSFIIALAFLEGRTKLLPEVDVHTLIDM